MATDTYARLLGADDPAPVRIINPDGPSPHLIVCDHAGRVVPRALGDLGVPPAEMDRHIAWDIGAEAVSLSLAAALDATAILQTYSRLVIDCNRTPRHPTSIPPISDGTRVPGNVALRPAAIAMRIKAIFDPYHAAIAQALDARAATGQRSCLIAMHSFTPVMGGVARPWQAGVLHDRNPGFARAVGDRLRAEGLLVGDNEPYQMSDEGDYTVPVHAGRRGLDYVELEVRQDLIASAEGQALWADLLARTITGAWAAHAR